MMTILHGENITASRQELSRIKTSASGEVITLDGEKVDLTQLKQALEAQSLLATEKLVVLENFLKQRKKAQENEILWYLKTETLSVNLVLWEGEEIRPAVLRLFPKAKIQVFKLDPYLFRFLDSLGPHRNQKMIEAFRQAKACEEVNLIFYMLIRQFRLLLSLKSGEKSGLEETDKMADWQKIKIIKQSQSFTTDRLLDAYRKLLEIDWQEKSGLAAYSLPQTLELFLARL